ncbi:MAG: zinc-ribbon domain-containing protein [Jatrophihabitans sp.]
MILFGYRGFAKLIAMVSLVCQRCGNPAAHQLVRRSKWFTLLFIPVIPLYFSRTITCTFCGAQTKVSKQDADQLLANSGEGQPLGAARHGQTQSQYNQPQPGRRQYDQPPPGHP